MFVAVAKLDRAVGMLVTIAAVLFALWRWFTRREDEAQAKHYPPVAQVSWREMRQACSGDDMPWFFWRTAQAVGSSIYRLPVPFGAPMVAVVGDYKLAREILNDKDSTKPSTYAVFDRATNGNRSLFTTNGRYWHMRRKGIAPGFSSNHVQRMNAVALAKTEKWIQERLLPLIDEGKAFDIGDEMIDLLITAIMETAFEYTVSPSEIMMYKQDIELILREILFRPNPLRIYLWLLFPDSRRARQARNRLRELCLKIINSYRALENPTQGTIINLIMTNPCYKNDEERIADVGALFIGGHDTTAYTLAWTLKELAQNPDLQSELRDSILHDEAPPHQLESVRNVIRESIRLHPVSAAGPVRALGRNFTTKDGKLLPTGSIACMNFLCVLRDPVAFGKDSDEFNPSRWDKEFVTSAMNHAFIPFAVGKQNCVGQSLANAELHCILPRIISQFELTVDHPGTTSWFVTLKPSKCMLRAKRVEN